MIKRIATAMKKRLTRLKLRERYTKSVSFLRKHPLTSFGMSLGLLFFVILLGSLIGRPHPEAKPQPQAKQVHIYAIGTAPQITVSAKIQKSGVVTIAAQTPGIVSFVNVHEGQTVSQGQNVVDLASNYYGSNGLDVQLQMAQAQSSHTNDTYDEQKNLIQSQRDLANLSADNQEKLQQIAGQSIDQTKDVINLDKMIIESLEGTIRQYEATNSGQTNDENILRTRQMVSQYKSAVIGLQQGLTNAEYQTNSNNPQAKMNKTQQDITLKQLSLQQKALDLNKEIAQFQLQLAQISASVMHPASPFSGVVQRVFVQQGEQVNPGTPLVQVSGKTHTATAVALVSQAIAKQITSTAQTTFTIDQKTYHITPSFVATEASDNQLYGITYVLPKEVLSHITQGQYISLSIPVGLPQTGGVIPFIPLDSVYQSQDSAFVFVDSHNTALSREVVLGDVYGQFVQVLSGLHSGDRVITNRNVIAGDHVNTPW